MKMYSLLRQVIYKHLLSGYVCWTMSLTCAAIRADIFNLPQFPDWQFKTFIVPDYKAATFAALNATREPFPGMPANIFSPVLWWHDFRKAQDVASAMLGADKIHSSTLKYDEGSQILNVPPEYVRVGNDGVKSRLGIVTPIVPFQFNNISARVNVATGLTGLKTDIVGPEGNKIVVPIPWFARGNTPLVPLDLNGFRDFITGDPINLELVLARRVLGDDLPDVPPEIIVDVDDQSGVAAVPEPGTAVMAAVAVLLVLLRHLNLSRSSIVRCRAVCCKWGSGKPAGEAGLRCPAKAGQGQAGIPFFRRSSTRNAQARSVSVT